MAFVSNRIRPVVSIVIPTFNCAETIAQCLCSILNQSYKDYEVIILDGLSTDDTISIIRRDFAQYEFVRFLSEPDAGIYDAMNKGIRMAEGKWLYFMGGDDTFYSTNTLQEISTHLSNADVVYGDVFNARLQCRYDGEFTMEKIRDKNICHQAIFFRKILFDSTGEFDIRFKAHADWDHNFKWFLSDKYRKTYVNLIVANYADGGFSSVNGDKRFDKVRNWKYFNLIKAKLSWRQRVKIIRYEMVRALCERRLVDFRNVVIGAPKFLA